MTRDGEVIAVQNGDALGILGDGSYSEPTIREPREIHKISSALLPRPRCADPEATNFWRSPL